jgi:orotidine-5'-phosphate decarboxylase
MVFRDKLPAAWRSSGSMLCVGLDPDPSSWPEVVDRYPHPCYEFCKLIVDATASLVCAFKPQFAYFAAQGAENDLERLCRYIRSTYPDVLLILDAKRGDIGPTAQQYAREAFVRYGADVVTVNPYMGGDTVEPYLHYADHGVLVLCRTSNPGGQDFQSLEVDGQPLYARVAQRVADEWNATGRCGLVVGGTYPQELAVVRGIVGDMPILVPGIGAQGGDIPATVAAGMDSTGHGMVINSSRAILYASKHDDFTAAAAAAAMATRDAIRDAAAGAVSSAARPPR